MPITSTTEGNADFAHNTTVAASTVNALRQPPTPQLAQYGTILYICSIASLIGAVMHVNVRMRHTTTRLNPSVR